MKRPWQILALLAGCLLVLLAPLGWATAKLLELDRAEQAARRHARHEETARLALWRMESALGPLIAEESTRPYFTYAAFFATERAYDAMLGDFVQGEVLLPSPLLVGSPPLTLVHFQLDSAGRLTSPQAPEGSLRRLAESGYANAAAINAAGAKLADLTPRLSYADLLAAIGNDTTERAPLVAVVAPGDAPQVVVAPQQSQSPSQAAQNEADYQARAQSMENVQRGSWNRSYAPPSSDVREGVLHPLWLGDVLLLIRRVQINDTVLIQGCQLDWPAVQQALRVAAADLLPSATVEPATAASQTSADAGRRLAALPVRLVTQPPATGGNIEASPLVWSLMVAWACVIVASLAVGALLMGTLALSERRASFVSAVTHELRTPLTTFRMYTELLADGRVQDEVRRKQYYDTLHTEALRLGHLVENVLAYARLDGGRTGARLETLTIGALYERVRMRLEERAAQAGTTVVLDAAVEELARSVRVDVAAVEQILFNLVDNACKYAISRGGTAIRVEVGRAARGAAGLTYLCVRDDGPGVAPQEARRLFRPFHKSACDAAHSAPGVGLGLSLCRRLARSMGGDLRLETGGSGACFVLAMPGA